MGGKCSTEQVSPSTSVTAAPTREVDVELSVLTKRWDSLIPQLCPQCTALLSHGVCSCIHREHPNLFEVLPHSLIADNILCWLDNSSQCAFARVCHAARNVCASPGACMSINVPLYGSKMQSLAMSPTAGVVQSVRFGPKCTGMYYISDMDSGLLCSTLRSLISVRRLDVRCICLTMPLITAITEMKHLVSLRCGRITDQNYLREFIRKRGRKLEVLRCDMDIPLRGIVSDFISLCCPLRLEQLEIVPPDEFIAAISSTEQLFPNLRRLWTSKWDLPMTRTDCGLLLKSHCPKLETVSGPAELESQVLLHCQEIRRVSEGISHMTAQRIVDFRECPMALKRVFVHHYDRESQGSDVVSRLLVLCSSLTTLRLSDIQEEGLGRVICTCIPHLRVLELKRCSLGRASESHSGAQLHRLTADDVPCDILGNSICKRLVSFQCSNRWANDQAIRAILIFLKHAHNLRKLDLCKTLKQKELREMLHYLPNVTSIVLSVDDPKETLLDSIFAWMCSHDNWMFRLGYGQLLPTTLHFFKKKGMHIWKTEYSTILLKGYVHQMEDPHNWL